MSKFLAKTFEPLNQSGIFARSYFFMGHLKGRSLRCRLTNIRHSNAWYGVSQSSFIYMRAYWLRHLFYSKTVNDSDDSQMDLLIIIMVAAD